MTPLKVSPGLAGYGDADHTLRLGALALLSGRKLINTHGVSMFLAIGVVIRGPAESCSDVIVRPASLD